MKLMAVIGGWLAGSCLHAAEFPAEQLEFFEKKIRPLLAENCLECHSTAAGKAKGELFLDHRDGFIKGGDAGTVVTLGQPEKSLFIKAVEYTDPELQMPPKRKLKAEQVADLKKWVQLGLPWPVEAAPQKTGKVEAFDLNKRKQSHWAWQPLKVVEPPKVKDAAWAQTPIDRFILAKLEAEKLKPAGPAEKRVLLRRLYFDLTGLPPAPEEVEAFVADASPDATQKLVKKLLASPQFGERWARHWLDMMRYAETLGHEFDYTIPNAWRYRDYVIRAFNADVPYNQFAKEHIAGDLLANPRRNPADGSNESVIGTGSFWLQQQKHSPVDVRQDQAELVDNQIDVISKTFLAMTVSCARCHDHKFDAISTKDYYSLYGIISSSRYQQTDIAGADEALFKATQMRSIRELMRSRLGEIVKPEDWQVANYWATAKELMEGKVISSDALSTVFADFEGKDFAGWTVTGDAFGEGPVTQTEIGSYQGSVGAVGKGFVNSHNARREGKVVHSDGFTGRMISPKFTLKQPYIHFLVGGGAHVGKTCVNLIVEGQVVRSTTGKNSNKMSPARFEVQAWLGKEAQLEIVDEVKGSWGNIGVDHIVFSQREVIFGADNQPLPQTDLLAHLATERKLDEGRLRDWVNALRALKLASEANGGKLAPDETEFMQASAKLPPGWLVDGAWQSSAQEPVADFAVGESMDGLVNGFIAPNAFNSAVLGKRMQGALRSPTFVIEKDFIHILAAGQSARINIVIDGFNLIRNPIYGQLKQTLNTAEPTWRAIDVSMWKGHRAYLELVDRSVADLADGNAYSTDGWVALDRVVFSPRREMAFKVSALSPVSQILLGKRPEEVAQRLLSLWSGWVKGKQLSMADYACLNWLRANNLLRSGDKGGTDKQLTDLFQKHRELESSIKPPVTVTSMTDGTPLNEHVFLRGSPRRLGDEVPRRNLEALGGSINSGYGLGSGRLQLAEDWVANPMLARVIVNKVWHHLMGRGIVPTVDNFGVLGQPPTHPELLDWLTADFQNHGWSIKRLIETIVLTQSYQMSSQPMDAGAEQNDPNNVWWHRMNIKRLEAEAIRDTVLAVSGRLDKTMYGPSVPIHLTEFMDGRGRPGRNGPLDGDGRRSVYVEVRRNFLSPMMLAFDAPVPATTVGRRTVSNVPAQALIMMNDPFVVQQAKRWAETLLKDSNQTVEQRLTQIYATAFGRAMTAKEKSEALEFLKQQGAEYGLAGESWQQDARVWADYCHVIFNVKEFVFVE